MSAHYRDPSWGLHSALISKLEILERTAGAEGIVFHVTSGRRGFMRQALFYSTFKRSPEEALAKYGVVSKPAPMGMTRHHGYFAGKCAAVDLGIEAGPDKAKRQARLGELGEEAGLVWGGRWTTPTDKDGDPVHFELKVVDGKPIDVSAEYVRLGAQLDAAANIADS